MTATEAAREAAERARERSGGAYVPDSERQLYGELADRIDALLDQVAARDEALRTILWLLPEGRGGQIERVALAVLGVGGGNEDTR